MTPPLEKHSAVARLVHLFAVVALIASASSPSFAQFPTGANHPELTWREVETEHFVLIYHDGLDSVVERAAPIAEEAYRVVTTNLKTPIDHKVKMYFSDNDEVKNAFAASDDHIFIWMRGILDDMPYSIRASGTSKWLRTVITHELTHTVIAHATKSWIDYFLPVGTVPRWFNEGMARYMEPDGWTSDVDMVLRLAAVSSRLDFNLDDFLGGTLMYEGGQSLVRYIAATYGDSSLVTILRARGGLGVYNFNKGVQQATKHSMQDIFEEWRKRMTVLYASAYGQREESEEFGTKFETGIPIVVSARVSPDGSSVAVFGKESPQNRSRLYLVSTDTNRRTRVIFEDPGMEPVFSCSPDANSIVMSKLRFGGHASLVHDLYRLDIASGDLDRLTSDARLEQPDWSPVGDKIVAVRTVQNHSDLVLLTVGPDSLSLSKRAAHSEGVIEQLTSFNDKDVQVYWPRFSSDGKRVAFSIFRANGMRDVATIDIATRQVRYVTNDSTNDRYAVWSPSGDSMVFVSHQGGVPNLHLSRNPNLEVRGGLERITNAAFGVTAWDWSKQKDSLLVTSFDSKNKVELYWVSPERRTKSTAVPDLKPKYTEWQSMAWPLVPRSPDSLPAVSVTASSGYFSLGQMKPVFYLPMLGDDPTKSGDDGGLRYGLFNFWADPQAKHVMAAYADYGTVSNRFGYYVNYINNTQRPNFSAEASSILGFAGIIGDRPYHQLEDRYALGATLLMPPPDALDRVHGISIGARHRSLRPWTDLTTFAPGPSLPLGAPREATLREWLANYFYVSPSFTTAFNLLRSEKAFKSDLEYTRLRLATLYSVDLGENRRGEFVVIGKGLMHLGEQLPQEFLGFSAYDAFQGGFTLLNLSPTDRLRGIREYQFGNRMLLGSAELRMPDPLFGGLVTLIRAFNPQFVLFYDVGSAWFVGSGMGVENVRHSAGMELRTRGQGLGLSGGLGWELKKRARPDWYIRVTSDIPLTFFKSDVLNQIVSWLR